LPRVGCNLTGEHCDSEADCNDGNDCTHENCKDVSDGCEQDVGLCSRWNADDGTECVIGGERGTCKSGSCLTTRMSERDAG